MKKILFLLVITSVLVTGCAQQTATPVQRKLNLKIGEKYGSMTLVKIEDDNAIFTGTAEVEGEYFTNELSGNICMTLDEKSKAKIPNMTSLILIDSEWVCFSNDNVAQKQLGIGEGKAKVKIQGYSSRTIDSSMMPTTTLVRVIHTNQQ